MRTNGPDSRTENDHRNDDLTDNGKSDDDGLETSSADQKSEDSIETVSVFAAENVFDSTSEIKIFNFDLSYNDLRMNQRTNNNSFEFLKHKWKLLILVDPISSDISVYIKPLANIDRFNRSLEIRFQFGLISKIDEAASHWTAESLHWDWFEGNDNGFRHCFSANDIKSAYHEDGDTITIRLLIGKTPCTISSRCRYDSKAATGMVGLKNQGATCYLNSLLQTLFHIRAFRNIVYEMPDEIELTTGSALQQVFYFMQTDNEAVSTKQLTQAFGWTDIDSLLQQDVQELFRILIDKLEVKLIDKNKDDVRIKQLFGGKMQSYIKCCSVDFQSTRDEDFYDIQLDVRGCNSISSSFDKYIEIEKLNEENQYDAGEFGKQDAVKGVRFVEFPPVLTMHLKRFTFDLVSYAFVKVHDSLEFPETLDITSYLAAGDNDAVYVLMSVLVHSGGVNGGHYYSFVLTHQQDPSDINNCQWHKFDDATVSKCDMKHAVVDNYGFSQDQAGGFTHFNRSPLASAYMLVYVKKSEWSRLMMPDCPIPISLSSRIRNRQEQLDSDDKKKKDDSMMISIKIITDDSIRLVTSESDMLDRLIPLQPPFATQLSIRRDKSFGLVLKDIASTLFDNHVYSLVLVPITHKQGQSGCILNSRPVSTAELSMSYDGLTKHMNANHHPKVAMMFNIKSNISYPTEFLATMHRRSDSDVSGDVATPEQIADDDVFMASLADRVNPPIYKGKDKILTAVRCYDAVTGGIQVVRHVAFNWLNTAMLESTICLRMIRVIISHGMPDAACYDLSMVPVKSTSEEFSAEVAARLSNDWRVFCLPSYKKDLVELKMSPERGRSQAELEIGHASVFVVQRSTIHSLVTHFTDSRPVRSGMSVIGEDDDEEADEEAEIARRRAVSFGLTEDNGLTVCTQILDQLLPNHIYQRDQSIYASLFSDYVDVFRQNRVVLRMVPYNLLTCIGIGMLPLSPSMNISRKVMGIGNYGMQLVRSLKDVHIVTASDVTADGQKNYNDVINELFRDVIMAVNENLIVSSQLFPLIANNIVRGEHIVASAISKEVYMSWVTNLVTRQQQQAVVDPISQIASDPLSVLLGQLQCRICICRFNDCLPFGWLDLSKSYGNARKDKTSYDDLRVAVMPFCYDNFGDRYHTSIRVTDARIRQAILSRLSPNHDSFGYFDVLSKNRQVQVKYSPSPRRLKLDMDCLLKNQPNRFDDDEDSVNVVDGEEIIHVSYPAGNVDALTSILCYLMGIADSDGWTMIFYQVVRHVVIKEYSNKNLLTNAPWISTIESLGNPEHPFACDGLAYVGAVLVNDEDIDFMNRDNRLIKSEPIQVVYFTLYGEKAVLCDSYPPILTYVKEDDTPKSLSERIGVILGDSTKTVSKYRLAILSGNGEKPIYINLTANAPKRSLDGSSSAYTDVWSYVEEHAKVQAASLFVPIPTADDRRVRRRVEDPMSQDTIIPDIQSQDYTESKDDANINLTANPNDLDIDLTITPIVTSTGPAIDDSARGWDKWRTEVIKKLVNHVDDYKMIIGIQKSTRLDLRSAPAADKKKFGKSGIHIKD